ncbi:hypothetical protein QFZ81_007509 [Paenibacillus sp. V4I9]|nr:MULTISPECIES: DUF6254 family protein [unclassified Paenibacillus]MDQ0892421.1 hypothetical protein [Paenibacillus sp. V4I9]
MSHSKRRDEAAWKSRKQAHNPHGKVKSLEEFASEYEAEQKK